MRASPAAIAFSAVSILLLLLAIGAVAVAAAFLAMPALLDRLHGLPENPWWLWYREPVSDAGTLALLRIFAAAAAACVSLVAAHQARALYRREQSPVIPFLLVFFFSLGLECLRAGTAILFATDSPVSLSILLTRGIYWGRFIGLLGLLLAALYCTGLGYRRFLFLAGVVVLISFAMAAYIPFDRTVFIAQLTWKLGDEQSVGFMNLAIVLLTVLSVAAAAFTRRGPTYPRLAIGLVLLVACRELQFFGVQPVPLAAGLLVQGTGVVVCLRGLAMGRATPTRSEVGRRSGRFPRAG